MLAEAKNVIEIVPVGRLFAVQEVDKPRSTGEEVKIFSLNFSPSISYIFIQAVHNKWGTFGSSMVAMEGNSNIRLRVMDGMRLAKVRRKLGTENEQMSKLYKFPNLIPGWIFICEDFSCAMNWIPILVQIDCRNCIVPIPQTN